MVNPDLSRDLWCCWRMIDESFRICQVSLVEDLLPGDLDSSGAAVMDSCGCEQTKPAVTVCGVVSGEEDLEVGSCLFEVLEATRVVRGVFDRLEMALRKRVVIRYSRTAEAGQDVEIHQKLRERLGRHRRASILVERELARLDALVPAGALHQPLCQGGTFPRGDHPGHDVAREEIEDHVEGEEHPFARAGQAGDVPGPDLVGRRGHQPGWLSMWVVELGAAFGHFLDRFQQAQVRSAFLRKTDSTQNVTE